RDALAGAFLRQRLGEAVNARFRRGVIDLAVFAGLAIDRADIHDAAEGALAHAVDDQAAHIEARGQVGRDHRAPLLRRHAVQHRVAGDAGIVDQHVDRAEFVDDALKAAIASFVVRHIEAVTADAGFLGAAARRLLIAAIHRGHFVPGALKLFGNGAADAARAAGDDRYPCHVALPLMI